MLDHANGDMSCIAPGEIALLPVNGINGRSKIPFGLSDLGDLANVILAASFGLGHNIFLSLICV